MGLIKGGKVFVSKSIAKGARRKGKTVKNKPLSEADRNLFGGTFKTSESAAVRKESMNTEMSIWDIDGAKKQWAAGATVGAGALGGAGYIGAGHQGKGKKKKDDTLKFLGY